MKKIVVLFGLLIGFGSGINLAQAVPPAVFTPATDRWCNAPLVTTAGADPGYNSYANGVCFTSMSRTSDGEKDDVMCWHDPNTNSLYSVWIAGPGTNNLGAYPFGPDGAGNMEAEQCEHARGDIFTLRLKNTAGVQVPEIVFDVNPPPYGGASPCQCECPVPSRRDGVSVPAGTWTQLPAYKNTALNDMVLILGSYDNDTVWAPEFNWKLEESLWTWMPTVHFYGGAGNDRYMSYGVTEDYFDDNQTITNDSGNGGNDIMWCETPGRLGMTSTCHFMGQAGNDSFWAPTGSLRQAGMTWNMGESSGDNDVTTPNLAAQVLNEESTASLPSPQWIGCPAWIQPAVQNGRWPGMQ